MTQSLAHTDPRTSFQVLRRVLYELQAATNLQTLVQVVASYIQKQLGYEFVWIGLYDANREILEGPWLRSLDEPVQSTMVQVLPGDVFDQVLLTRQFAVIPSLQEEKRAGAWQQLAKDLELQGSVLHSLRYQRESLGVLLVGTSKWGISPRQDESEQFTMLANTIGSTLQYLNSHTAENSIIQTSDAPIEETFSALLHALTQCNSWDEQLAKLLQSITHLAPVSGLYLLDTENGEFVCEQINHPQHKKNARSRKPAHTLSLHQNLSFVKNLERQALSGVGDVASNLGASIPHALITFFNARAFLFQPILIQQTLKGFWVLGHPDPTQWTQTDKDILARFANLVELTYPSASSPSESSLIAGESLSRVGICVLPSPFSDLDDWEKGLGNWFRLLTQQFQCHWCILLTYDEASGGYRPTQHFSTKRRVGIDPSKVFKKLSDVDEKLLIRHENAVDLSDLQDDMRLLAWRDQLLSLEIQSVLVGRLSPGANLDQLLLLGNTSARAWSIDEKYDLHTLSQNLYQAQYRRELHVTMLDERRLNHFFRQGLQILQRTNSSHTFVEQSAQVLVDQFGVSACAILLWPPKRKFAKVKAAVSPGEDYFAVPVGTKVELTDPLIQQFLRPAYDRHVHLQPVAVSSRNLSEETQRWLFTRGDWSLLGLPLQPQPHKPVFGVLLLASPEELELKEIERETLSDFVRHMAWVLYNSHVNDAWRKEYETLHTAHWYHNKMLGGSFEAMLHQCLLSRDKSDLDEAPPHSVTNTIASVEQSVTQLYDFNARLIPEVQLEREPITLVRLLREILDRLESTFATKQIWVQVHHLKQSNVALHSSKVHLMYVLDEVLKAAVVRSEVGGRIDVWCQMNHPEWLDLSITDEGQLDRQFLRDLNLGHHRDRLRPSLVSEDIGQRLLACHALVKLLGGKLEFHCLEDKRTLSRFTLPCVTN